MRNLLAIYALDDVTFIRFLYIFKLGFLHPSDVPGKLTGLIIGIWRFEIQLILGFWDKGEQHSVQESASA